MHRMRIPDLLKDWPYAFAVNPFLADLRTEQRGWLLQFPHLRKTPRLLAKLQEWDPCMYFSVDWKRESIVYNMRDAP